MKSKKLFITLILLFLFSAFSIQAQENNDSSTGLEDQKDPEKAIAQDIAKNPAITDQEDAEFEVDLEKENPKKEKSEKTMFDKNSVSSDGMGGPVIKFSEVNGEFGLLMGGRGAWIINHMLSVGGGGYSTVNDLDIPSSTSSLFLTYGGFILEGIFYSDKLFHLVSNVLIGSGSLMDDSESINDTLMIIEPEVSLEINVVSFLRLNFGTSYRVVLFTNTAGYDNSGLSGISGVIAVKFGSF
ncbi:MAG: hypothetical protein ABIA04_00295 [Pseudomonadota bacterium]